MLKASFKWMLLALAVFVIVTVGVYALIMRVSAPTVSVSGGTPAPTAGPTPGATPVQDAAPAATAEPTPTPSPVPTAAPVQTEVTKLVRKTLSEMSVEEKLGQLVMFGFVGTDAPAEKYQDIMRAYHVGNAVLYGPNIESGDSDGGFGRAKKLTTALENINDSGIPLLVSIDVEGGSVVRFTWSPWPSSARTLGRNNDPDAARAQFLRIGTALKNAGINADLAPVLDIAEKPMDTFLTTRIISSSAETASSIGTAVIEGLSGANCLSTAKHFPGHGGTNDDSHAGTPVVDKSAEELLSYDLVPFRAGVAAGVDLVLVSHISYPALDAEHIASQSKNIMTDLLRGELGFEGVVMSDDFRMKGLTDQADAGEAAVNFINAGGDLILCGAVPETQRAIMDALIKAAADGTLTKARIDESVSRILEKKIKTSDWLTAG